MPLYARAREAMARTAKNFRKNKHLRNSIWNFWIHHHAAESSETLAITAFQAISPIAAQNGVPYWTHRRAKSGINSAMEAHG